MKSSFLIFSLPRSGSAWLSVFLSSSPGYCFHEPLADGGIDSLRGKLSGRAETSVGFVDTLAYQYRSEVIRALPTSRRYVLLREPSAIEASITKTFGIEFDLITAYEKFLDATTDCYHIYYEHLHNLDYLAEIWGQIIGLGFDRQRAEYLMEMNIQRNPLAVAMRLKEAVWR